MEVRRLALLRELARRSTVTEVARAVSLTPTAVSQQLKLLEREAGVPLLRRVGRRLELTAAGRVLVNASTDLEVSLARLHGQWDAYRGELRGTVRLAVFPTAAQLLLPGTVRQLQAWPDVVLDIVETDVHGDRYPGLVDDVDLVVGHHATELAEPAVGPGPPRATSRRPRTWEGLAVTELVVEPLDVAVSPAHRLSARASVRLDDVRRERWVSVPAGWPFDDALQRWFAGGDGEPVVAHRFTDLRLQEAFVAADLGIALLPRFAADDRDGQRLVLLPTQDLALGRRVAVLSRRDHAERAVTVLVRDALVAEARSLTSARETAPAGP
ncbi:LysR family transcriptional regulator [Intrasporangium calvum]|uniref:Transcriptional regulator, LysR family n=1 Tax=Intrasporangium calvum (strain ATCC 23552 / DSM 43043 / JCM 3097 / NBRC 12989 / NCIMB 10167 / NRRL B-3866 / 7 KIP) TaxID=710696 RepID=E6S6P3_INTC7|nr:LysR family transcriptional regulator [Intrasporangium calvum]ADU50060.1 transcriptional regulator, LysR family [Intrasporangium calvum DSM 43043]AXG14878.1 LysR family transcriptional regulator [Intrasporangium calvum]